MAKINNNNSLKSILGITLMTAALGLTACSTNPDVKARQDSMKSFDDTMGIIKDMIKAPDTFDTAVVKEQAAFLAKEAKNPWSHFEDKEAVGNATEAVWANVDGFRTEAEKFQQVTADFNNIAQTATSVEDIEPAFKKVGKTCKSCHTDFRVKDDD